MNQSLGTGKTLAAAQQLGIPGDAPNMKDPSDVDVLGYAAVHVVDMANAYNTISAEGKKAEPYFISKVSSAVGDYGYNSHPNTTQAIAKDVAANLANGMTGPLTDSAGTAHYTAGRFDRPAAGKTGTSSNYKSAWFTGFTPNQLTVSVGMYAGNGKEAGTIGLDKATHNPSFYGGDTPATIWLDFMNAALNGKPVAKLPKGTDVTPSSTYSAPPSTQSTMPPTSTPPTTNSTTTPSSPTETPSSSTAQPPTSTSTPPITPTMKPTPTRPTLPITPPPITPGGGNAPAEPQSTR
jgi:membrane peptidoglycan carboxypeptidase